MRMTFHFISQSINQTDFCSSFLSVALLFIGWANAWKEVGNLFGVLDAEVCSHPLGSYDDHNFKRLPLLIFQRQAFFVRYVNVGDWRNAGMPCNISMMY